MAFMKREDFASPKALSAVEIAIFFSIAAILAVFFYVNYFSVIEFSRLQRAKTCVYEYLPAALETYKIDMGDYPSNAQGLEALFEAPVGLEDKWKGPYATNNMSDPWGSDYKYRYPSLRGDAAYDLWSFGPDKKEGTSDDISNLSGDSKTLEAPK